MDNFLDKFYQTSIYHNEDRYNCGLKKLPNGKVIFWICETIYFIIDLLEKEILIELDIIIKTIDILESHIFFIKSSKCSYLYFFNDDYSLNKKMNLSNTELLLKLSPNTFIFLEKSDTNKLVIMKIEKDIKIKQYIHVIKKNIDINSIFKVCKITNKKFLFYLETKNNYYYIDKTYYIYNIDFKNKKFIINETSFDSFSYSSNEEMDIDSFVALNEKYIIQFSYISKVYVREERDLIIHLINIETFQIVYKYITNIKIKLEEEDYFSFLSKYETEKEPAFYVNDDIDVIPYFQIMKVFDEEKYNKFKNKIIDFEKNKKKGFIKLFIRLTYNIEKIYILYFYQDYKIYLETIEINFLNTLNIMKIKLVDDDFECGGEGFGPYYFTKNIGYNEKSAIIVNEESNYFILMLLHTNGWFHSCIQIIGYS